MFQENCFLQADEYFLYLSLLTTALSGTKPWYMIPYEFKKNFSITYIFR
jgi:hypothetical protein